MRKAVGLLAILFLAAHVPFLPAALEDIDSINFALGVRDFNVAQHQPHPPGYPVYIALAKVTTAALGRLGVDAPDVRGLALLSALGGAAMIPLVFLFVRGLDGNILRAFLAAVLTACTPLLWFNAARPLSDLSGLAVAFAALACLGSMLSRSRLPPDARAAPPMALAIAAGLLAGLAIGIRSQMAVLTLPLFAYVLLVGPHRLWMIAAAAAGVLVWAVPLVVLSGGLGGYLAALGSQAGEDFAGVVMLWTNPTPRVAVFALLDTLVRPWDSPVLGGVVVALAATGVLVLWVRARSVLALLTLTFVPYAVFHLLFQETLTMRYALPLVPLVACLVAATLAEAPIRAALAGTGAIAIVGLSFAVPAAQAFGRIPSPIFGFLSDAQVFGAHGAQPLIGMHRRIFTESRRPRAYVGGLTGQLLPAPRDYEWLELTRTWRESTEDRDTWFIADPRRTDLALIDRAYTRTREYRWPFNAATYVGGVRPNDLDWHIFTQPGWFLEQGWALTPEAAGISDRDGWGPHRKPSVGWIRRRDGEAIMMIGGRHLGGDPPVRLIASLDGRPAVTVGARPGYFLEFATLPAGSLAGAGRYAALTVAAQTIGGGATPPVAIEQFDLQSSDRVLFGYDQGWFEPEYNPATGRSWRWMSERGQVRVHHAGHAVRLRLTGESPLRYFDDAPLVRVSAGTRELFSLRPSSDFTIDVVVPADAMAAADGRLTITSDRAFVAGEREGTADQRRLALRIYSLTIQQQ